MHIQGQQARGGQGHANHQDQQTRGGQGSFQSVSAEAFCQPTEDLQKVLAAFKTVCGDVEAKREKVPSYYGPEIVKLSFSSTKPTDIKLIAESVKALNLQDVKERMDERGQLFVRFDKQAAYIGKLAESEGGDVVKVKLKVAVYPFDAQRAREKARELLG